MVIYYFVINNYSLKIDTSIFSQNIKKHIEKYQGKDFINSYYAYKLLKEKINDFNVYFSNNGKPLLKNNYVSISHSNNVVAVAISMQNVGIDIQKHKDISTNLIKKIVPEKELLNVLKHNECFFDYWTLMEAKCKFDDNMLFKYFKKNIQGKTYRLNVNDDIYSLSVISKDKDIRLEKLEID